MADPARAMCVLRHLDEIGVRLAIDDFGAGRASLAYLRGLPVSELKIDRSFVMDLSSDTGDAVIVRSTIDLGHTLGLRVVAEGVETPQSAQWLREHDCDVLQGDGIGRPLPASAIPGWLERWRARERLIGRRSDTVGRASLAVPTATPTQR